MLEDLLTDDVTIYPALASPDDPWSEPADPAEGVSVKGALQQRSRDEVGDGEVSRTGWLLVLEPDAEIATGNTVDVDGMRFTVEGDPAPVKDHQRGTVHHLEASLLRIGEAS